MLYLLFLFIGVVLAIAVALLVGGLLVVAFFTTAVEFVIDDVSTIQINPINCNILNYRHILYMYI